MRTQRHKNVYAKFHSQPLVTGQNIKFSNFQSFVSCAYVCTYLLWVKNAQYSCSSSPGAHKTLWGLFMHHLKIAKITFFAETSTSNFCACVRVRRYLFWGVILLLPTFWIPKEVRIALGTHCLCLGIIFEKLLSVP